MRALVQRVSEASVAVDGEIISEIGGGLVVFVGIRLDDNEARAHQLAQKVTKLRIFPDEQGKMNRNVVDTSGALLVVSQFTLYGDTRKGNRPSYLEAAQPELAEKLYNCFINA